MIKNIKIKEIDFSKISTEDKNKLAELELKLDQTQEKLDYITKQLLKQYNKTIDEELEEYKRNKYKLFYLYDKDKIIGFSLSGPTGLPKFYNIHQLYIEPEYRHQTLGKLLLIETINTLKTKYDIKTVGIEAINANNIAVKLYSSLGFEPKSIYYRKEI